MATMTEHAKNAQTPIKEGRGLTRVARFVHRGAFHAMPGLQPREGAGHELQAINSGNSSSKRPSHQVPNHTLDSSNILLIKSPKST
eukprot:3041950-Amphidinium_carterae.1